MALVSDIEQGLSTFTGAGAVIDGEGAYNDRSKEGGNTSLVLRTLDGEEYVTTEDTEAEEECIRLLKLKFGDGAVERWLPTAEEFRT